MKVLRDSKKQLGKSPTPLADYAKMSIPSN